MKSKVDGHGVGLVAQLVRVVSRIIIAVAGVLAGHAFHASASEPDRPNFLVVTSEDMSANLGCYGDPDAITPNLDELARHGNAYSAAFATAPICSPARSALLFSMYQASLGAGNHRSRANTPTELLGFATHLRKAGYFCTNAPKVDYNSGRAWEIERETYDRGADWRSPSREGRPFLSIINIEVSHQSYTSVLPFEQYRTSVRNKLPASSIHDPAAMRVPPYFPDTPAVRKELARYADCVSLMDRRAGEILDRLKEDGLHDDTVVIYFSDHGAGHPRHKSTPFASGLRVPLIVYCPPRYHHLLRAPAGEMCDDVVSFIDIGPTLLNLAGVEIPDFMHGVPFLGADARPRELAFGALDRRAESFNLARTVTDGRYVYIRSYMPHIPIGQPKGYGFPSAIYQELARLNRSGQLKEPAASYFRRTPTEMLFDLASDPYEVANLAGNESHAATLARLRAAHHDQVHECHDVNFLPEEQLAFRAGEKPWAEAVSRDELAEILDAAGLVGRGPDGLGEQMRGLGHDDPAVRWWSVIGLRQQQGSSVDEALRRALDDTNPTVRIEAAAALIARDISVERSRDVLRAEIAGDDARLSHRAARAAQLARLHDDDMLETVQKAAGRHATEWLHEVSRALSRQRAGTE